MPRISSGMIRHLISSSIISAESSRKVLLRTISRDIKKIWLRSRQWFFLTNPGIRLYPWVEWILNWIFPQTPRGARSRLYRRRVLQVNTRWKALAEIYTMHSFAPFFNLKTSTKNRQHFFAIEWLHFWSFHFSCENLHSFSDFFMKICPDFATNSRKEWRLSLFNQICENKLENCRKF